MRSCLLVWTLVALLAQVSIGLLLPGADAFRLQHKRLIRAHHDSIPRPDNHNKETTEKTSMLETDASASNQLEWGKGNKGVGHPVIFDFPPGFFGFGAPKKKVEDFDYYKESRNPLNLHPFDTNKITTKVVEQDANAKGFADQELLSPNPFGGAKGILP